MPDGRTAFSIFQIVQPVSPQPTPSITRTVPTAVVFGGIGSKLEIIGQGFVPGSIVLTNGTPNQTVVIMSNSHLQIQLSGHDVLTPLSLQVVNPTGGTSGVWNAAIDDPANPKRRGGQLLSN